MNYLKKEDFRTISELKAGNILDKMNDWMGIKENFQEKIDILTIFCVNLVNPKFCKRRNCNYNLKRKTIFNILNFKKNELKNTF